MDKEIVLVIPPVHYLEIAEWDVADSRVKEAVRQCCVFIALYSDRIILIQLLCYSAGNTVKLYSVYLTSAKAVGQHTFKVTYTH